MQAFALLHDDENATDSHGEDKQHESCHETEDAVAEDEARNGSSCGGCRPVDVASLQPEELQWTLQSLENGIIRKTLLLCICHNCQCFNVLHTHNLTLRLTSNAEEQRQCLGCCNEENTCADDHHDLLFQNLLPNCKVLNINTPKKQKVPKETNWKQKFQKPQNENICLTYLNTEMNGNFHFLSFCAAFLKVQNQVL